MTTTNIYIAGHNGMVGSALLRKLQSDPNNNIITANRQQLDLTEQSAVRQFFSENHIDQVYLAAAKVGGIHANNVYPAEFIYQNLMIEANVIHAAHINDVDKLLFLGSSCIYPKFAQQPIKEEALLTGTLEPTNEPYGVAKIAGIKLCESYARQYGRDYRSAMPSNLYGPHDNFHLQNAHVIPALIRRFHEAKINQLPTVTIWGTGTVLREFLHVDDMADASIAVMNTNEKRYKEVISQGLSHINVGTGRDCSIKQLVDIISTVTAYKGQIEFDTSKPDGTPRKLMDVSRLKQLGWQSSTSLSDGIKTTYQWFLANQDSYKD